MIRNVVIDHVNKRKRTTAGAQSFAQDPSQSEQQVAEVEDKIEEEWKTYVANLAMERVKDIFSGKAVEVFSLSLDEVPTQEIAQRLEITPESVYTLKNRVRSRYIREVKALIEELEG